MNPMKHCISGIAHRIVTILAQFRYTGSICLCRCRRSISTSHPLCFGRRPEKDVGWSLATLSLRKQYSNTCPYIHDRSPFFFLLHRSIAFDAFSPTFFFLLERIYLNKSGFIYVLIVLRQVLIHFPPNHMPLCLWKKRPCLSIAPWSQIVLWLGEPVVLPDQLIGSVVLVGDGDASPGDGGYVAVVVVGVFVGIVAAGLVYN